MTRIELPEHSEVAVEFDDEQLDAVIDAAAGRLGVRRVAGGGHVLTSGSHVGVLAAGDVEIAVQPKIPIHNLFLMLGVRPPEFAAGNATFGHDTDLLTAMVRVFTRAVESATSRGVLRGYRHTEERLISPRGRIDIAAQIRRPGLPSPIPCRFDEFTVDIDENRALVAALDRLRRVPGVSSGLRSRLVHLAPRFADVPAVAFDPSVLDRWQSNRLNRHYEPALRLAAVILRSVTLRNVAGDITAPSFMINMNDLFQDFVADRLRSALRGRLDVIEEPTVHLGSPRRLAMRPDLVFQRPGAGRRAAATYVGDAKYKLSSGPARMSDYYQLLAYTTALGLDDGVLIYAQRPDEATTAAGDDLIDDRLGDELVHTVRIRNTSTSLHVYRLPLTGTNDQVEAGLVNLADWIHGRSHRRDLLAV